MEATGTTTNDYVQIMQLTNSDGLLAIGAIKNTHGSNSMKVKIESASVFGEDDELEVVVLPGAFYKFSTLQDGLIGLVAPYSLLRVSAKSLISSFHATYELRARD